MRRPGRVITCAVCAFGGVSVKGGNLVKSGNNEYRHEDIVICNRLKNIRAEEERKRAQVLGLAIPERKLVIARRRV